MLQTSSTGTVSRDIRCSMPMRLAATAEKANPTMLPSSAATHTLAHRAVV